MKLYHELAEHYFAIESHHRNLSDDAAMITSAANTLPGKTLIDLGCGTGEHCFELSRRGFSCTGIDISIPMLQIAGRRFPEAGNYIQVNILELSYLEEFDVAISLFGTLNYLIDDDEINTAFSNIMSALRRGGLAVLEIWNSYPVKKIRQKKLSRVSTTHNGDTTIERFRGFSLLEESPRTIVEVKYRYIITDNMGTRELADQHIMRAFSKAEIEMLLKQNGFRISQISSGSRGETYRSTSNRIIYLANKN